MADILTIGESLGVLHAVAPDTVELAGALRLSVGGAESNVAIGASRLGATVAWVGRVGDDLLGRRVVREIRAEGVQVHAAVDASAPTGLLLKEVQSGRSRVRYYRAGSAGSRIEAADLPTRAIGEATVLHLTGITPSLSPSAEDAVMAAIEAAEYAGTAIAFDVNHRGTLPRHRDAADMYRDIARRATIVFAGEDEARLLVPGAADLEGLLVGIESLGPSEVIIKEGARGSEAIIDGERLSQPATPATVIDTVGAGDAFVAGYLADRVLGRPASERLLTAARCGAAVCSHPGDWEGAARRRDFRARQAEDPVDR